jgi:hypothetical protein
MGSTLSDELSKLIFPYVPPTKPYAGGFAGILGLT